MKKLVSCLLFLLFVSPLMAEDICDPQGFLKDREVVQIYSCNFKDAAWCYAFKGDDAEHGIIAMTNSDGVLLAIVQVDKEGNKEFLWSAVVIQPPKTKEASCVGNCA